MRTCACLSCCYEGLGDKREALGVTGQPFCPLFSPEKAKEPNSYTAATFQFLLSQELVTNNEIQEEWGMIPRIEREKRGKRWINGRMGHGREETQLPTCKFDERMRGRKSEAERRESTILSRFGGRMDSLHHCQTNGRSFFSPCFTT